MTLPTYRDGGERTVEEGGSLTCSIKAGQQEPAYHGAQGRSGPVSEGFDGKTISVLA